MASVIKRPGAKKWTAIYYDRHGKQIWKVGFSHRKATQEYAQELEDREKAIAAGLVDPDAERLASERRRGLAEHIDTYEQHLRAGARSDNHIAYTLADIRQFATFSNAATAAAITREQVDRWVLFLTEADAEYRHWLSQPEDNRGKAQGEPNSARTINRRVGSLQAFLKWCASAGIIHRYPLNKYPKQETRGAAIRQSRVLTDEEIAKLLAWADTNAPGRGDVYRLALSTGLRADEIAGLTAESFDLEHGTVTVHGKDTCHSDRVDTIPIDNTVVDLVKRRSSVFAMPLRQAAQLQADCAAAGVNPKGVTFHGLRHTFITRLAKAGVHPTIAQELARHRDVAVTLSYYTHWQTADKRAALALVMPTALPPVG